MNTQIYQQARLRFTLPVFLVGLLIPVIIGDLIFSDELTADDSSVTSIAIFLSGPLIIFLLFWVIWCRNHKPQVVLGSIPTASERRTLYWLSLSLIVISIFSLYLLYYPLSIFYPSFVESWLLDTPEILRPMDEAQNIRYNLANIVAVVLLAPVMEEFIFRGFLLGRLQQKFNAWPAIIISSLVFALLHEEVLGAFIFAVFMCLIRYKYHSLIAPMIVHIAHNLIIIVVIYVDEFLLENSYENTIEEFQRYWWLGLIGLIYGAPALYHYYRRHLSQVVIQRT